MPITGPLALLLALLFVIFALVCYKGSRRERNPDENELAFQRKIERVRAGVPMSLVFAAVLLYAFIRSVWSK